MLSKNLIITMTNLIKNLKSEESSIKNKGFWENKASIVFGGDGSRLEWIKESLKPKEHFRVINIINNYIYNINNSFFIILVFLTSVGLIVMYKSKSLKQFLLYLILYGSLLLLLLVEGQNRYMYAIQPLLCILSVPGINYIKNKFEDYQTNKR